MYLLGLGIVFLVLKLAEIGPVSQWSWWGVLTPFALAAVWWQFADWSGYTKRKAVERDRVRTASRVRRSRLAEDPEDIKADF